MYVKVEEKPLWRLLADLSPEELVSLVDFRYIDDAITKEEALTIFRASRPTMQERLDLLQSQGFQ